MTVRIERDSMGEVEVPIGALYGAQTQRAVNNFRFSSRRMPTAFLRALALIKAAASGANHTLGILDADRAGRIIANAIEIGGGQHLDQFPVDVFQTGSGTSTNMNMNEVLSHLCGPDVHPNDHVNMSQSSNDVIPSCIQVSAALELERDLLPSLRQLVDSIGDKASSMESIVKTGRTHLMDAMPLTLGQEMRTWQHQVSECIERIKGLLGRLKALPLGGTAVGTGVNCPPGFPALAIAEISRLSGSEFTAAADKASRMAAQDCAVECSSALKSVSVVLMKLANDLRWMASGPLSGLAEIELTPLQPGSSIMPGKVNPVLPEAVAMIAAEVMGNDVTVTVAAQSGNFQLNVMLPIIAEKLLTGIGLLARAAVAMAHTIDGIRANEEVINASLRHNPILVTALNQRIGYEAAAAIAKKAYATHRNIIDVAAEETDIDREELQVLLDPMRLTRPSD